MTESLPVGTAHAPVCRDDYSDLAVMACLFIGNKTSAYCDQTVGTQKKGNDLMSIAANRAGGNTMTEQMRMPMPTTTSTARLKRESSLEEARMGLARAIEADKPAGIQKYWRDKIAAITYLLGMEE